MKNSFKRNELIKKGFSEKTIAKLTESQVNILHKKLVSEAQVTTSQFVDLTADEVKGGAKIPDTVMAGKKNITISPNPKSPGGIRVEPTTEEVTEDDDLNVHVSDDPDASEDGMGMFEAKKEKNPWAICTAQMGKEFGTTERSEWSKSQMTRYERCVKDVKKSLKEGKKPVSLFLEEEIYKIVEKHLPPKITKADLMKYLTENKPATAPTKPTVAPEPTTKPGKPDTRPRPMRPGQNPHPGEKEAPRAKKPKISPEEAKDKVIKSILSLFKNGK